MTHSKVDVLMELCNRLEESLTATATTRRRRRLNRLLAKVLTPIDAQALEAAE